jgi:peptidoglycan-associated lipoprotein
MVRFVRLSLLLVLSALLLAGFGCATKIDSGEAPAKAAPAATPPPASVTPAAALAELPAGYADAIAKIEKNAVYFAYDRYDLNDKAKAALKEKADLIKKFPKLLVKIEGHCDERGTEEYNLALGERRARAAYDYLVMLGVAPSQLSRISYGKLDPASSGSTEAAWANNRRDEFRATLSR